MADFILIHGDKVNFDGSFMGADVIVKPGKLSASGPATLNGKKLCVEGDEKKVTVSGCSYKTSIHATPGTGTLKILGLMNHKAIQTSTGGKKVLLKGADFLASFEVQSPAKSTQTPPVPDPVPMYVGTGSFETANDKLKGI